MASPLPAAVKAADLARFAMRAAQLERAKPVISYYCNFWMMNQILSKKLHSGDEECWSYTSNLMDKLEQFRADNQENDVVTDELAGRAYVEQFGLETFQRADNAVRANRASRQTADTFQAAATFLELLQIWGEIDPENAAKIKYAKYHALRIAKALKAGQDPNASNPAVESSPSGDALPALDPNDAEVQMLNGGPMKPRQPSVTEVPDEADRLQRELARQSSLDESLHPSRASSVPRPTVTVPKPDTTEFSDNTHRPQDTIGQQSSHTSKAPTIPAPPQDEVSPVDASTTAEDFYNQSTRHDISPLGPEPPTSSERKPSIGGNYFPQIPSSTSHQQPQPQDQAQQPSFTLPSAPSLTSPPPEPSLPPTTTTFPPSSFPPPQHPNQGIPPPTFQPHQSIPPHIPQPSPPKQQQTPHHPSYPPSTANSSSAPAAAVDEESILRAQKHARWAISALNFEDVPTAVRELRGALEVLGARP